MQTAMKQTLNPLGRSLEMMLTDTEMMLTDTEMMLTDTKEQRSAGGWDFDDLQTGNQARESRQMGRTKLIARYPPLLDIPTITADFCSLRYIRSALDLASTAEVKALIRGHGVRRGEVVVHWWGGGGGEGGGGGGKIIQS